jgi:hypothetical protein
MADLADVEIAHGPFHDLIRCAPRYEDLVPWGHESVSKVIEGWGTTRDGVDLELMIYEHHVRRQGRRRTRRAAVAIVRHPKLRGRADVSPDLGRWGPGWLAMEVFALLVLGLLLLPFYLLAAPFWLAHAGWLLVTGRRPTLPFPFGRPREIEVGDPEFDRLYTVRSSSVETARAAIPESIRAYLVANRFMGKITFHDGGVVIGGAVDEELRLRAEAIADAVAKLTVGHPMR